MLLYPALSLGFGASGEGGINTTLSCALLFFTLRLSSWLLKRVLLTLDGFVLGVV